MCSCQWWHVYWGSTNPSVSDWNRSHYQLSARPGVRVGGCCIPQCGSGPLVLEMDRVLKRVGLSKRTQSEIKVQNSGTADDPSKVRRRRRSKSRRRTSAETTKKTRGLFNIDWESVKYCKSCKSRAITRRLCSRRCDNELYRSNSFKFERFVRGSDEISTLGTKVITALSYSSRITRIS